MKERVEGKDMSNTAAQRAMCCWALHEAQNWLDIPCQINIAKSGSLLRGSLLIAGRVHALGTLELFMVKSESTLSIFLLSEV